MNQLDDLDLIREFREGNEQAFNQLVLRYQERVYWVARRLLRGHDDADDVVQEVFIKVHSSLGSFKGDSSFFTWLYRIATNLALNELRRRKLRTIFSLEDAPPHRLASDLSPEADLEQREHARLIDEAVARLPEKQKRVFVLRYFEELSYQEISKILKTSVGGLKANYFHAVRKIGDYVRRAS